MTNQPATSTWLNHLELLINQGNEVNYKPDIIELLGTQFIFNMNYPVIHHNLRGLDYISMVEESLYVCDNPKVNTSIIKAVNILIKNIDSKHGVVRILDYISPYEYDHSFPVLINFIVRDGKLNTFLTICSEDIFVNLPYDLFSFTMLSIIALSAYNNFKQDEIKLGNMYLNFDSCFIYKENLEVVKDIINNKLNYINWNTTHKNFTSDWVKTKRLLTQYKIKGDRFQPNLYT